MRSAVLFTLIVTTAAQTVSVSAQISSGLAGSVDSAARPSAHLTEISIVSDAATPLSGPAEPMWLPDGGGPIRKIRSHHTTQHRGRVSHRRVIGALIGAGTGIAIGYAVGSRCGPGAPRQECAAYGSLTAAVFGGLGALIGSCFDRQWDRPRPGHGALNRDVGSE